MPIRKRKFYKRKNYRRKSYSRSTRSMAMRALSKVSKISRGVELKKSDPTTFLTPLAIPNTGVINMLTYIAQGSQLYERIGSEISIKYISLEGVVTKYSSTTTQIVRFIMFIDKQEVPSSSPALTEMLENSPLATSAAPFAKLRRQSVGRFQILRSFRVYLNADRPQVPIKVVKKFYSHNQRYNGTTSTSNQKGTVWLATISDVANNEPTFTGTCRVSYTDV